MTKNQIKEFKDSIESIFLDKCPEWWADRYYNYDNGNGLVVQLEAWEVDGEWMLGKQEFNKGSGAHSHGFWNCKGDSFSVWVESSEGLQCDYEEYRQLNYYFKKYFGSGISNDLKNWVSQVKEREDELENERSNI